MPHSSSWSFPGFNINIEKETTTWSLFKTQINTQERGCCLQLNAKTSHNPWLSSVATPFATGLPATQRWDPLSFLVNLGGPPDLLRSLWCSRSNVVPVPRRRLKSAYTLLLFPGNRLLPCEQAQASRRVVRDQVCGDELSPTSLCETSQPPADLALAEI